MTLFSEGGLGSVPSYGESQLVGKGFLRFVYFTEEGALYESDLTVEDGRPVYRSLLYELIYTRVDYKEDTSTLMPSLHRRHPDREDDNDYDPVVRVRIYSGNAERNEYERAEPTEDDLRDHGIPVELLGEVHEPG